MAKRTGLTLNTLVPLIGIVLSQALFSCALHSSKRIIATSAAPAAIGPYSQAVQVGGTLYLSGQIAIDPGKFAMKPLVPIHRFSQCDAHFVSGPVGIILRAGERTVDAGAAHFEVISPFDQLLARFFHCIDRIGNAARERHALIDNQLPGRRIFSHHLQSAFFARACQLDAHEIEAERVCLWLDHFA